MSTSSSSSIRNQKILGLAVVAAAFLTLSFVTLLNYTRVPFWDSWGLFGWLAEGDRSFPLLWAQHNEHRIVLTKILAVIDFEIFGGYGIFLVISNLLLGAALFALLAFMIRNLFGENNQALSWALITLSGIMSFSLMQLENYGWEFQPQFFLAYLLPLASIYFFVGANSNSSQVSKGRAFAGLLLAIASLGAMANGVLTAFVLSFAAILLRRWVAAGVASALALVGTSAYFIGYSNPGGSHSTLIDALTSPVALATHFLALIGSPVRQLLGGSYLAAVIALTVGLLAFLTSLYCVFRIIILNRHEPALISFASSIVFILLSLAVISVGRFSFGVGQAFSPRYTTPVLALWLLIICLLLYFRTKHERDRSDKGYVLALAAVFALSQILSIETLLVNNSHRQVAALAVASKVPDLERISQLYPDPGVAFDVSVEMASKGKGIFSHTGPASLGSSTQISQTQTNCTGYIDEVFPLPNSDSYRVTGWVTYDFARPSFRYQIVSLNSSSVDFIDGLIARGLFRADVAQTQGTSSMFSGFEGYSSGLKPHTGPILNCSAVRVF